MCKAPKPPKPTPEAKPEWLRNPYLDAAVGQSGMVDQLRSGRSSLRIDQGLGLGTQLGIRPLPHRNPNLNIASPAGPPPRRLMRGIATR